jgi:hypothetical protein
MTKNFLNVFELRGVENLTDISIALSSAFRTLDDSRKKPRRACVEIIPDVLLQHGTVQTRRWLNALISELKSKGFTTLAVMDPTVHPRQEVRAILGLFEGEINIYEKGSERFLKVKKMSNQKYVGNEIALTKTSGVSYTILLNDSSNAPSVDLFQLPRIVVGCNTLPTRPPYRKRYNLARDGNWRIAAVSVTPHINRDRQRLR